LLLHVLELVEHGCHAERAVIAAAAPGNRRTLRQLLLDKFGTVIP
jgi:hypothetical protein